MPIPQAPSQPTTVGVTPQTVTPNVVSKDFHSSIVDSKIDPISSLLIYAEGSFWKTDWFSQIKGKDEELSAHQPDLMAVFQQLYLIKGLQLKVTAALTSSQDDESTTFTRTGSAILPPFVKPNNGDTFIADIGDGLLGVFNVTNVKRATMMKQSTYSVEYSLMRYYTPDIKADLEKKVIQTAYYKRNMLLYGKNPVIAEEDVVILDQITALKWNLLNRYLMAFFNNEYKTLTVPGQKPNMVYDHFVTSFILNIFDKSDHPLLKKIRLLNIDGARMMEKMNLWSILLDQNGSMSDVVTQVMFLVTTMDFSTWPSWEGIAWSGMDYAVYPYSTSDDFDPDFADYEIVEDPVYHISLNTNRDKTLKDIRDVFPSAVLNGLSFDGREKPEKDLTPSPLQLYHPVGMDEYYVLSGHFYHKTAGQSTLELLINTYLQGEPFDIKAVFAICKEVPKMGKLEQFYYIPLLLMLLIVSERSNR